MFGHNLGDDLVLGLDFGLQRVHELLLPGRSLGSGGTLKSGGAVFKEGLLPLVEERRADVMFFANVGDGAVFDEVLAQNGDFLFACLPARFAAEDSKISPDVRSTNTATFSGGRSPRRSAIRRTQGLAWGG